MTGGWGNLLDKEFHNLCFLLIIIRMMNLRRMRLASHVARMGKIRNVRKAVIAKPEGRSQFGIRRR